MLHSLLAVALVLALDSFAVAVALGATGLPRRQCRWLALAFGVCDGLASLLGATLRPATAGAALEWCEWLGPATVAAYGFFVLSLAWRSSRVTRARGWLAFGLPLCLSLDNLVVGVGVDAAGAAAVPAALTVGAVSGALALAGLRAGAVLAERARPRSAWLGGAVLIGVAVALACREVLT